MADYQLGDHVTVLYVDLIEAGQPRPTSPLVEGVIVGLPTGNSPYYELTVNDEEVRAMGGWVSEEAEGLTYLAKADDIRGVLPRSLEPTDVEAWLAT